MNCTKCGAKAHSELCFRCKPKKPLKRTRIKRKPYVIASRGKKRAKQERKYFRVRREVLEANPICEVLDCNNRSDQIHHKRGRIGELLTDKENLLAVCYECHKRIEKNPNWAKENGYSLSRLSEKD